MFKYIFLGLHYRSIDHIDFNSHQCIPTAERIQRSEGIAVDEMWEELAVAEGDCTVAASMDHGWR